MKRVFLSFLICFSSVFVCAENIHLVFRLDGVRLNDADNRATEIVKTFSEVEVPLSVGVVPCDVSENYTYDENSTIVKILHDGIDSGGVV